MRLLLCLAACSIFSAPRLATAADEPDPIALLKAAHALTEKLTPAERERLKTPLAVAEYQFGDRELGRKLLADALDAAKKQEQASERISALSQLIGAQQSAGLTDDARATIRVIQETEKQLSEDEMFAAFIYGLSAIDFFASLGDVDGALKFIDAGRTRKGVSEQETEDERKRIRARGRLTLVTALIKYEKMEQAEKLWRQSLADFPELDQDMQAPQIWILLGKSDEGRRALEEQLNGSNARLSFGSSTAITHAALALIKVGDKDEARKLLKTLAEIKDVDRSRNEFKIYASLGEYDKALETLKQSPVETEPPSAKMNQRRNFEQLTLLAAVAGKTGRRDVAERCLAEAEKPLADEKPEDKSSRPDDRVMMLGMARFYGGDSTALLKAGEKSGNPMMLYLANVMTAVELNARKTGKKLDSFWPRLEIE